MVGILTAKGHRERRCAKSRVRDIGQVGVQCNTRSGNQTFLESTLVFAVGARFNDRHTGAINVYKGNRKIKNM